MALGKVKVQPIAIGLCISLSPGCEASFALCSPAHIRPVFSFFISLLVSTGRMKFELFTYQSVTGNPMWWFLTFSDVMLTLEYLVSLTSLETSRAKQAWTCIVTC